MENPTKASTAKLRTIIAIAVTSMMESRFAMRQFFWQSSDGVDLDQSPSTRPERFAAIDTSNSPSGIARPKLAGRIVADEQVPPRRSRADVEADCASAHANYSRITGPPIW